MADQSEPTTSWDEDYELFSTGHMTYRELANRHHLMPRESRLARWLRYFEIGGLGA